MYSLGCELTINFLKHPFGYTEGMDPLSTLQVDILKELSSLTTTPDIPDAAYDLITRVCRLQDMATETTNTCTSALNEIRHYGLLHRK